MGFDHTKIKFYSSPRLSSYKYRIIERTQGTGRIKPYDPERIMLIRPLWLIVRSRLCFPHCDEDLGELGVPGHTDR